MEKLSPPQNPEVRQAVEYLKSLLEGQDHRLILQPKRQILICTGNYFHRDPKPVYSDEFYVVLASHSAKKLTMFGDYYEVFRIATRLNRQITLDVIKNEPRSVRTSFGAINVGGVREETFHASPEEAAAIIVIMAVNIRGWLESQSEQSA